MLACLHGLYTLHSSTSVLHVDPVHNGPRRPVLHEHLNALIAMVTFDEFDSLHSVLLALYLSTLELLLEHGFEAHSSLSCKHELPLYPATHVQLKESIRTEL